MEKEEIYDEISLKELIEILLKNKILIIAITLIVTLLAGIFSFLIVEPTYEADVVLMPYNVGQTSKVDLSSDNIENILNKLTVYPSLTLETYKEQIRSDAVLIKTIESLGLGEELSYEGLRSKVSINANKDSNNITLTVTDTDPEKAVLIANALKDVYIEFVAKMKQNQLDQSIVFLDSKVDIEKENLSSALRELESFLIENTSSEEIGQELFIKRNSRNKLITDREDLINDYEQEKIEYQLNLNLVDKKIEVTEELLNSETSTVTLNKDIYSDLALYEYFKSLGIDTENVNISVEEKNEVYYELKNSLNGLIVERETVKQKLLNLDDRYDKQMVYYDASIGDLKDSVEELNIKMSKIESEENLLMTQVEHSNSTYEALLNKRETIRITEASKISENSILVVSEAYKPIKPVSPNKMLNLAIGFVLGLMVSVFIAFFRHYWKNN
ncbi:MAG: Wzz/FepE/Etk N-terminal domain-containing protein [Bacillota bacterium]|nr:Wzz/FepE/Etk N-terminal domain-containing protein [Bacillota bacterium]